MDEMETIRETRTVVDLSGCLPSLGQLLLVFGLWALCVGGAITIMSVYP